MLESEPVVSPSVCKMLWSLAVEAELGLHAPLIQVFTPIRGSTQA